jgi:hypothetical protein
MGPIEITYAGRRAALSLGEQVLLAPHIAVLEQGHPDRTFVCLLCIWAREVLDGGAPGPYRDDTAHVYARSYLMPGREFWPLGRWADHRLAEHFGAPLAQIAQRRKELERDAGVALAPGAGPGAL